MANTLEKCDLGWLLIPTLEGYNRCQQLSTVKRIISFNLGREQEMIPFFCFKKLEKTSTRFSEKMPTNSSSLISMREVVEMHSTRSFMCRPLNQIHSPDMTPRLERMGSEFNSFDFFSPIINLEPYSSRIFYSFKN